MSASVLVVMALVLAAAWVRIAVVLSVLRSAIGFGVLPRSVVGLAALALSAFVMLPVLQATFVTSSAPASNRGDFPVDQAALVQLQRYLDQRTPAAERKSFVELAGRLQPAAGSAAIDEHALAVLAPAWVLAELKVAFEIGFLLFLPFLVLELVVAVVLTTLGMHALDPRAVALPFKLLLFVAADGWHLLGRGLVLGFT